MEKKILFGALIIVFLMLILSIFLAKNAIPPAPEPESMMTKAICDENNYCEDYEITCQGTKVAKISPTGAIVQFSEDWEDPRTQEDKEIRCD